MTRSVASARIHRHTHYGSPVIPPRLAATTSGSLALPCTLNYTEAIPTPQPFQSCAVGVLGSAHKKGTRKGCLMRKVRSFGRPTSAYPLRLTQYTSSPRGDYVRVLALPCTLNYTEVIPTLATGSVTHGWGSRFGPQKRHPCGCLMCQDRQERPESSSFHTLTPSSLGPEGGNYRFILTTPTIRRLLLPRNRFSHAWSGSRFGAQKRRTPKGSPLKRYEALPYGDHASYP